MITRDSIQFGTTTINYDIIYRSRRKNATLAVYPMKHVEITVQNNLELEEIQNLVRKKSVWVIKKLDWFDQITQLDSAKEYVNGETYLYLGRQYRLNILKENKKVQAKLRGKYLEMTLPEETQDSEVRKIVKTAMWDWYRKRAQKKIRESVRYYCKKIGIQEPQFRVKNQYKRWGSCTSKNILNFNLRAVMAPKSQLDYVIAHELCHIKHKNHSTQFWKLLQSIMPDYKERKEKLRKEGWQYVL